jgi:methylthioribose-1-phosphate isomerase
METTPHTTTESGLPPTLYWQAPHLLLLDQRLLPHQVAWVSCASAVETATAIQQLVVRGAPAIGCAAALGIAAEAHRLQQAANADFNAAMAKAFEVLAASRPTAVNLFWALTRMRAVWQAQRHNPSACVAALTTAAEAVLAEDIAINQALGQHGAELLNSNDCVLTHCNAGALATAGYGTALGVIRAAIAQGKQVSVLADETRPFLQGARLTAWELMQDRIPVTLITDNMAGHLMQQGRVQAVVVGTDRVAINGDVANKIGTYMVAVLAHRHNIPFYVACPLSTLDPQTPTGADIPLEERSGDEVTGFDGCQWAPSGVPALYPAFDITPVELVTAIITEVGVVAQPNEKKLRALLS